MKKYIAFLLFLVLLFMTSCNAEQHIMKEVDQDCVLYTQLNRIYDESELLNTLEQHENIYDSFACLGIDWYKSTDALNYTVIKSSNGLYFVSFSSDGLYGGARKIVFSPANSPSFHLLEVGMTLQDVKALDPAGNYEFLFRSWTEYPRFSFHFFENGECFFIEYDNANAIKAISFFMI